MSLRRELKELHPTPDHRPQPIQPILLMEEDSIRGDALTAGLGQDVFEGVIGESVKQGRWT
jgi:hypothetical protein